MGRARQRAYVIRALARVVGAGGFRHRGSQMMRDVLIVSLTCIETVFQRIDVSYVKGPWTAWPAVVVPRGQPP